MENLTHPIEGHIEDCEEVLERNNISEIHSKVKFYYGLYQTEVKGIGRFSRAADIINGITPRPYDRNDLVFLIEALKKHLYSVKAEMLHRQQDKTSIEVKNENPISFGNIGNISGEVGNVKDSGNSTNTNTNNNTNTVDLKVMFDSARKVIEEDEALGEEEVQEIISRINEIEEIGNEDATRPQKWRKLKDCVSWISTKGVKVATTVMPLIIQMLEAQNG